MRIPRIFVVVACLIFQAAKSQYYFFNNRYYNSDILFEIGASAGLMNCLTDLGGNKGVGKKFLKDLNTRNFKPSFGGYFTMMYKDVFSLKLEAAFGSITAYDSILEKNRHTTFGRYERSLHFKTGIAEIGIGLEIHPLFFKIYEEVQAPAISPYLIAGVGIFSFNPIAELDGSWYFLHPLHLEGQGFDQYPDRKIYKLVQCCFPLGIGAKYELSALFNARIEFIYRVLTTDYLDDVSTGYIDPALFNQYLSPKQASIARQLSDRQGNKYRDM
jgi:hypothetical protein